MFEAANSLLWISNLRLTEQSNCWAGSPGDTISLAGRDSGLRDFCMGACDSVVGKGWVEWTASFLIWASPRQKQSLAQQFFFFSDVYQQNENPVELPEAKGFKRQNSQPSTNAEKRRGVEANTVMSEEVRIRKRKDLSLYRMFLFLSTFQVKCFEVRSLYRIKKRSFAQELDPLSWV